LDSKNEIVVNCITEILLEITNFEDLFIEKQTTYIVLKTLFHSTGKLHINLFELVERKINKITQFSSKSFMKRKYDSLFSDLKMEYTKLKESLFHHENNSSNQKFNESNHFFSMNLLQNRFQTIEKFINFNKENIFK